MKRIVIYVHGKGGSAREAEHYGPLLPESEVIGFDHHAAFPWEAEKEFPRFFAEQRRRRDSSYTDRKRHRCVFLHGFAGRNAG